MDPGSRGSGQGDRAQALGRRHEDPDAGRPELTDLARCRPRRSRITTDLVRPPVRVRPLILGIAVSVWFAQADPATAQDPDSLPPVAEDDRIEDEYEDDEEGDPRLRQALRAFLAELAAMTPPELVPDTTAPGVQAGGTEIRLVVPGTQVLVREDGDDPRDASPPTIYGEEICPSNRVEGQFEPAQ